MLVPKSQLGLIFADPVRVGCFTWLPKQGKHVQMLASVRPSEVRDLHHR